MTARTIRIIPRKGVQLAGIPAGGADVPAELGQEWIRAGLARQATPTTTTRTPATPAKEG